MYQKNVCTKKRNGLWPNCIPKETGSMRLGEGCKAIEDINYGGEGLIMTPVAPFAAGTMAETQFESK